MTILLYGYFPGKATEIIRNIADSDMKLLKSEKIILVFTLLFLASAVGVSIGSRKEGVRVEFVESSFESRGADHKAGLQLISGEDGDEIIRIININSATAQELESLYGIGPVLAERIIEYREEKGGFRTIEDITKVRGIGAAVYNEIWQYISVE